MALSLTQEALDLLGYNVFLVIPFHIGTKPKECAKVLFILSPVPAAPGSPAQGSLFREDPAQVLT